MKVLYLSLWFTIVVAAAPNGDQCTRCKDRIQKLEQTFSDVGRQLMMQQLFLEERIRSDGHTGIKQIRHYQEGTRPYYGETYSGTTPAAIHDHVNYDRTVGMGEFVAVMNGVEFRTRHNDYKLRMPSRTSTMYHAVEDIPFPDVPPSVLQRPNLNAQIYEMRRWFQSWNRQARRGRDYKKYFKPVLCYLEGAWIIPNKSIDEPFQSDRHHLDAASWFDMQEKIRFTSYSGSKSIQENYAFLPTTIMTFENGIPQIAQWNYRILCHPLKRNIKLSFLKPIDELSTRFPRKRTMKDHIRTKAARFHLNSRNFDRSVRYGLLDQLMSEIPGKDNYQGNLVENTFGSVAYDISKRIKTALNAAYYHRWFKVDKKGAMGVNYVHRGYSDENLFVAKTTQPQVANMSVRGCYRDRVTNKRVCKKYIGRYTYAIPLEIIFLTPLSKWNPYNLMFRGSSSTQEGDKVFLHGRNGGFTRHTAYNGTNSETFYHTPTRFFDTSQAQKGEVGVLDGHGRVLNVVASGIPIFLPNITGIGVLRQRYPILPVHSEGSPVWKELETLKEIAMHMNTNRRYFVEPPNFSDKSDTSTIPSGQSGVHLTTSVTIRDPPGSHSHDVFFTSDEITQMQNNTMIIHTSQDNGHSHELDVMYNTTLDKYVISLCDHQPICWDGHTSLLYTLNT